MAGGRPFVVAWHEDAATLKRLSRAEADAQLRPRWQALWLLRQGRSGGEVATVVGGNYRTVQDWVAWYRHGGLSEVRRHRRAGKGWAAYLSPDQQHQLVA